MNRHVFIVLVSLTLIPASSVNSRWIQGNSRAELTGALRAVPTAPTLIAPSDHATAVRINPTFTWTSSSGATSYQLQVSSDSTFSTGVITRSGLTDTSYHLTGLSHRTIYYWRVSATSAEGMSVFSVTFNFRSHVIPGFSGPGETQSADAYIILRHVANITILTGDALETAEVSGDGTVSAYDAALVLQVASGLLSFFPVDE